MFMTGRRHVISALISVTAMLGLLVAPSPSSGADANESATQEAAQASRWTQAWQRPTLEPHSRSSMAYDAARGELVLVVDGGGETIQTWTWEGSGWTLQEPTAAPPVRINATIAYDAAREEVVLFGGSYLFDVMADTWTWDGETWTEHEPSASPPQRFGASMAYDAAREQVVLFGGEDCNPVGCSERVLRNDTWTWDGQAWTQRTENMPLAGPPPRSYAGMAYDATHEEVVLFGGKQCEAVFLCARLHPTSRGDTWTWDGTSWTERNPVTSPTAREGAQLVYDRGQQRIVLFGGESSAGLVGGGSQLGDLWSWDGDEWREDEPAGELRPEARKWHSLAYDDAREVTVLTGGWYPERGDTWTWDGVQWERVPRRWPTPGVAEVAAYDPARAETVVFKGGETFVWDGSRWLERIDPVAPSNRSYSAMAYHQDSAALVLFGGSGGHSDTWSWDGRSWTELQPTASPPARAAHAMAHDRNGAVMLFGGNDPGCNCPTDDTWLWDGQTWTEVDSAVSPPPRAWAAMAHDPVSDQVLLFGGYDRITGEMFDDTWTWDGSTWTEQVLEVVPPPRYAAGVATDPAGDGVVLYGGRFLDDTWLWTGTEWVEQDAGERPTGRWFPAMAEHAASGTVVLFGGQWCNLCTGPDLADVWIRGPVADVSVTATVSPQQPTAGNQLTYAATVRNDGPADAHGVAVEIALSPDLTFVSAAAGQGACTRTARVVRCEPDRLVAGASVTVEIVVEPAGPAEVETRFGVSSTSADHNMSNNTVEVVTDVRAG